MSMKTFGVEFWGTAPHAMIIISGINRFAELSPMSCFIEALAFWRNATLPCMILVARMASHARGANSTNRNIKVMQGFDNRTGPDLGKIGNLSRCLILRYVGIIEPFFVLVRFAIFTVVGWTVFPCPLIRMIMPNNVNIPVILTAIPSSNLSTSALTNRCKSYWKILNWFASLAASMRLSGITIMDALFTENGINTTTGNIKESRNGCSANPRPILCGSRVESDNFLSLPFC